MFKPICALWNAPLLLVLLASITLPAHSPATDCDIDVSLIAGDEASGYLAMPSDTAEWIVEIPSPGILNLDVTVPNEARVMPWLAVAPSRCGLADVSYVTIERSAVHHVLAIESAGRYRLRIGARDPEQALGYFQITSRFVGAELVNQMLRDPVASELFGNGTARAELIDFYRRAQGSEASQLLLSVAKLDASTFTRPEQEEFDPDPLGSHHDRVTQSGSEEAESRIRVLSPLQRRAIGALTEQEEFDPDPKSPPGGLGRLLWANDSSESQRQQPEPWLEAVRGCQTTSIDDHADTFSCATPLVVGRLVDAWAGNSRWKADADIFTFSVPELTSVDIIFAGAAAAGALYDAMGHRLANTSVRSQGMGYIARFLDEGTYFVRLEGELGSSGPYQLSILPREMQP